MNPADCPHCEYDRQFPETAGGGWVYMGNNGPIGPCPVCNPSGTHPRGDADPFDDIPEFLLLTSEQRRASWERNPPKPAQADVQQRDKRKAYARIAALKASKVPKVPKRATNVSAGKRWCLNTSKWIDDL